MENVNCCTCKKPIVGTPILVCKGEASASGTGSSKDTLRCPECHDCRSRLERLWSRKPLLKSKFQGAAFSTMERFNFINEAKNLLGAELELLVERTLAKRLIHTKEDLDQLEVEWLDEKDLAERFKDRPDKKEKIMENGRQRECPILQCTLYGVPIYKSLTKDSTKDIEEQSAKGCEESKLKAPKKLSQRRR